MLRHVAYNAQRSFTTSAYSSSRSARLRLFETFPSTSSPPPPSATPQITHTHTRPAHLNNMHTIYPCIPQPLRSYGQSRTHAPVRPLAVQLRIHSWRGQRRGQAHLQYRGSPGVDCSWECGCWDKKGTKGKKDGAQPTQYDKAREGLLGTWSYIWPTLEQAAAAPDGSWAGGGLRMHSLPRPSPQSASSPPRTPFCYIPYPVSHQRKRRRTAPCGAEQIDHPPSAWVHEW